MTLALGIAAIAVAFLIKVAADERAHKRLMGERLNFERYVEMAHEERPRP